MLSNGVMGRSPRELKPIPIGTKNRVTKREISMVSKSDRIVTISAEKKMK
jgi:hypothetical protein